VNCKHVGRCGDKVLLYLGTLFVSRTFYREEHPFGRGWQGTYRTTDTRGHETIQDCCPEVIPLGCFLRMYCLKRFPSCPRSASCKWPLQGGTDSLGCNSLLRVSLQSASSEQKPPFSLPTLQMGGDEQSFAVRCAYGTTIVLSRSRKELEIQSRELDPIA